MRPSGMCTRFMYYLSICALSPLPYFSWYCRSC